MRKIVFGLLAASVASVAHGQSQNSNTNCYAFGNNLNCHTTTTTSPGVNWQAWSQQQQQIQQQNQQNMNQAFANLGAALAERRERQRQEKAAKEAEAQQDRIKSAIAAARAADTAPTLPPPTDEQPVFLVCTANGQSANLALYEKHSRIDITADGETKSRPANFTSDSVSWTGPIARDSVSRLDGSYTAIFTLPELSGQTVTGSCEVATQRRF